MFLLENSCILCLDGKPSRFCEVGHNQCWVCDFASYLYGVQEVISPVYMSRIETKLSSSHYKLVINDNFEKLIKFNHLHHNANYFILVEMF